jgi:hypothetical protein
MPRVLSLVTFRVDSCHRDEFLRRAVAELKPYWEAHGSERYEVYEEMGPTGPTGRFVELNVLKDREAYEAMARHVRTARDLPAVAYRHAGEPSFQVMEWRT